MALSNQEKKYLEFLEHQFLTVPEIQQGEPNKFSDQIQSMKNSFNESMKNLSQNEFTIRKIGKKLSFLPQTRQIKISSQNLFEQVKSKKVFNNPIFTQEEIPKNLKLDGFTHFLPLKFDDRLVIIQLKSQSEMDLIKKYIQWYQFNNVDSQKIKTCVYYLNQSFKNNFFQNQFKQNLNLYVQQKRKEINNLLQQKEIFNNYDKLILLNLTQTLKTQMPIDLVQSVILDEQQIIPVPPITSIEFQDLIQLKKQSELQVQTKNQNKPINFKFNYIDYESDECRQSETQSLTIKLKQTQSNNRAVNQYVSVEQVYFCETFELENNKSGIFRIGSSINKQTIRLVEYDQYDTIQVILNFENQQFSNEYPIYLALDKKQIGQPNYFNINQGLYLQFDTIYDESNSFKEIIYQNLIDEKPLYECIYGDQFFILPYYSSYHRNYCVNGYRDVDDFKDVIYDQYEKYSKNIAKNLIVNQNQIDLLSKFINQLYKNNNETQNVNLDQYYTQLQFHFNIMQRSDLYDEQTLMLANSMLLNGVTLNMKLEFYKQFGQILYLKQSLASMINQQFQIDVQQIDVYQFLKSKINTNCQLQQNLRDDFQKFNIQIGNQFQLQALFALQTWVQVIQQYTLNGLKINYGKYIISYAFRILQIIINHDFYNNCPIISEELIFWLILSMSIFLNHDFQDEIKNDLDQSEMKQSVQVIDIKQGFNQVQQKLKINLKISNGLKFLRYSIKNHHSKIYEKIQIYNINIENMFADSLQHFCSDLLNANIYYRILDIAFGLIQEGLGYLHFGVVMTIFHYFEDYIQHVDSQQSFIDFFKYCCQRIFDEQDFIQVLLHFRLDLDLEYQEFSQLINQKNLFYQNQQNQQQQIQQLVQDQQGIDLVDLQMLIGQFTIDQKQNKVYNKVYEELKIKQKTIYIFIQNPQKKKVNLNKTQIKNDCLEIPYQNQNLVFECEDKIILEINSNQIPVDLLVQQYVQNEITIYLLCQSEKQLGLQPNFSQLDNGLPQLYWEEFLHRDYTFKVNYQDFYNDIQSKVKCNVQSVFVNTSQWQQSKLFLKKDLQQTQDSFTDILKQVFKSTDQEYIKQQFYNYQYQDFILQVILNANGTIKQKLCVIYQLFKLLNNDSFNIDLMQTIFLKLFNIANIPISRSELLNLINITLYQKVNYIEQATLKSNYKEIDIKEKLQQYIDYQQDKYGAQTIILDNLEDILCQKQDDQGSFISENQEQKNGEQQNDEYRNGNQADQENGHQDNLEFDVGDVFQKEQSVNQQQENAGDMFQRPVEQQQSKNSVQIESNRRVSFAERQQQIQKIKQTQNKVNNDLFMAPNQRNLQEEIFQLKQNDENQDIVLEIKYTQNSQSISRNIIYDSNFKIKPIDQETKFLKYQVLNFNQQYIEIEFIQFLNVFNSLQLLKYAIVQDGSLNYHTQKQLIDCIFKIIVDKQEIIQIEFKQTQNNKLQMLNLNEYNNNLQLIQESKNDYNKATKLQIEELDIQLPFKYLQKQISNFLIKNHLEQNILNLNKIDFNQQAVVSIYSDITPPGINELSLLDIQQITQKGIKDLVINIEYQKGQFQAEALKNESDTYQI